MTQPGWYPDPSSPFFVRWWDGQRWLNEVRPMGPDRAGDVAEEAKTGRAASLALRAGAVLYAGEFLVNGLLLAPLWRAYRQWSDALQTNSQATLVLPRSTIAVNLLSSLFSLGLLVVGVMWIIWFQKAATWPPRPGCPPAAASAGKGVIDDVNRVHSELVRH